MHYSGSEGGNVQLMASVISGMLSETVMVAVRFRTVNGTAEGKL